MRPRLFAGLLLALLFAKTANANPIRANTPGTGVFQRSGLLAGIVVDEKEAGDADLRELTSFVELRYTPATHWVLAARVPWEESRLDRPGEAGETASGLGDVVVSVKHRFYRWVGPWADRHAAVEVGLKLPTGATDRPVDSGLPVFLRHRLQPGTGSADGLIDLVYQQARRRWVFAGDAGYRFNGEGEGGYREGGEARVNLSAQYIVFPRVYTVPGHEVFAVLEGTFVDAREDRLRGSALRDTDRTAVLIAPGLQYFATERLFLDLSVQFPLHEEGSLESRWNALVQARWAF
jgi:hypothetical protein